MDTATHHPKGVTTMTNTTTTTKDIAIQSILDSIERDMTRSRTKIARFLEGVAEATVGRASTAAENLIRAEYALAEARYVRDCIEDFGKDGDGMAETLLRAMHYIALRQGDAAMNMGNESRPAIEGRIAALRQAALAVSEAFEDSKKK